MVFLKGGGGGVLVKNRESTLSILNSNRVWFSPCSLELGMPVVLEEAVLPNKSIYTLPLTLV